MADEKIEKGYKDLLDTLSGGVDLAKDANFGKDELTEVIKELQEERKVKAKAKAREVLEKIFDLRKKMVGARREFEKAEKKFNEEQEKQLKQVKAALSGQPAPAADEEKKEETGGNGGAPPAAGST